MIEKSEKIHFLVESLLTRYRIGGFLVGDQVKILDKIKSHKAFKSLTAQTKEVIEKMTAAQKSGDAILKISGINQTPWLQGTPEAKPASFDIAIEEGGGLYIDKVTLPGELIVYVERLDDDLNQPEMIPFKRKIYHNPNPEPVEVEAEPKKAGWTKHTIEPIKDEMH